jgi:hypothetical protein
MDASFKTNRFRLPLFNIVGTTLLNTTFYVEFVLTNSRTAEAFTLVFKRLQEVYRKLELDLPRTIITDKEGGLITPIREMFPDTSHLLCIWYINEDITAWVTVKLTVIEELNRDTPPEEVSTVERVMMAAIGGGLVQRCELAGFKQASAARYSPNLHIT